MKLSSMLESFSESSLLSIAIVLICKIMVDSNMHMLKVEFFNMSRIRNSLRYRRLDAVHRRLFNCDMDLIFSPEMADTALPHLLSDGEWLELASARTFNREFHQTFPAALFFVVFLGLYWPIMAPVFTVGFVVSQFLCWYQRTRKTGFLLLWGIQGICFLPLIGGITAFLER